MQITEFFSNKFTNVFLRKQATFFMSCNLQLCVFVSSNFVPNLIVVLFNLLYPVFIVRFYYKGCVIERESAKTQAIEDKRIFAGSSRLSIPRNDACALHMTEMQRVKTNGDSCVLRVARR